MGDTMTISTRWLKNDAINFENTNPTGARVIADPAQTIGAKPTELLLMSLASCSNYDVVGILQKARQDITDVRCKVTAKRADSVPAVFTDIHLHFVITGTNLKPAQIEKAIHLSADKYCSVGKMLSDGGVVITHDYEMIEA